MNRELENRIAIITGGARGIGRAIAERMAAAGARVVIGDLVEASGGGFSWHPLDVSDEASIEKFVRHVVESRGAPSILVNNAGIISDSPITELAIDEWNRVIDVNLRGPFLMAKHVVPYTRPEDRATIVNIGSLEGLAGNPNHCAYMASKAGLHGLTVSMAIDLGAMGIRANAIAPGWISTEFNNGYLEGLPNQGEVQRQLDALHPIGCTGDPGDIGDVAVWLASDKSRFVTGQIIKVEGGRTSRLPLPQVFDI